MTLEDESTTSFYKLILIKNGIVRQEGASFDLLAYIGICTFEGDVSGVLIRSFHR